jgi:hypothetical protein
MTVSFENYSAKDEVQIIFAINKMMGICEYQSRQKYKDDNQNMELIHYRKLFLKRKLTINVRNLIDPRDSMIWSIKVASFPALKLLILYNIHITTMETFSNLDCPNL